MRRRRWNVAPPKNEADRKLLCGFDHSSMEQYWDKNADKHSAFFLAGQTEAPPDTSNLWDMVIAVSGENPDTTPQPAGDCFPAGTMVAMADGTEKPIEAIEVGDFVLTHTGAKASVLRLHSREYTGKMNTIKAMNVGRSVTATANHEFIEVHGRKGKFQDWCQVSLLSKESSVLVPASFEFLQSPEILNTKDVCGCNPNESFNPGTVTKGCIQDSSAVRGKMHPVKNAIPDHVKVDGDFGRLIGLYLAEGGSEGCKVQFSFSSEEADTLVKETQSLLKSVFNLESSTMIRHANKSCIVVSCHSAALVKFLKAIIPGNIYTKAVPDVIMRAPFHVRQACICGWLDGDGYFGKHRKKGNIRFSGVSASRNLGLSITRLALSIGQRPSFNNRTIVKNRKHRAITVDFNGDAAVAILDRTCTGITRTRVKNGFAFRVRENTSHEVVNEMVYCIEVDHPEHSFIANSYAVHNCVAAAAAEACEALQCAEIYDGDAEEFRDIYKPFTYAAGRVLIMKNSLRGRDGAYGGAVAEGMRKYGVLEVTDDLPDYNKQTVQAFGDDRKVNGKSFRDYMEVAGKRLVGTTARIDSMGHLFEAVGSKYPVTIASNRGYAMMPDRDGFHRPSGTWSHQMGVWGYSISGGWVAVKNQWGDVHGQVIDFKTKKKWPPGFMRVRIEDFEKYHFRGAEVIAYSRFSGFPQKKYDHRALA